VTLRPSASCERASTATPLLGVIAAVLVVVPLSARAQPSPPVIGSATAGSPASEFSSFSYEWDTHVPVVFHAHEAAGAPPEVENLPEVRLEAVDEARYGFSAVSAYFERRRDPAEEPSWLTSSSTLRLWLATHRADGRTRWWRLDSTEGPDVLAREFDPLWISDAPDTEDAFPGERPSEKDGIDFVASEREPVIVVRYFAKMSGANSGSQRHRHLLVDLRTGEPRALGLFDEIGHDCGGVCTHTLCLYAAGEQVGCRWDSAANDFICASTFHRTDTAWFERRGTRRFRFSDGTPLPRQSQQPAADVDPAIPEAAVSTKVGEASAVAGLGPVSVIADVPAGGRTIRLLAAPALTWRFGVRFFAATIQQSRRGAISEIGSRVAAVDGSPVKKSFEDTQDDERPNGFTPDGQPPTFVAGIVERSADLTILRVRVSEGDGRGVYLVGLQEVGGALVSDAVLIATDGRSHRECARWMAPATAVGMTVRTRPFQAVLDVECERTVDEHGLDTVDDEQPAADPCSASVTLAWASGQGFAIEGREKTCRPRPARSVHIDDSGNLTVVGVPRPTQVR
jgi:hypothetical protein